MQGVMKNEFANQSAEWQQTKQQYILNHNKELKKEKPNQGHTRASELYLMNS